MRLAEPFREAYTGESATGDQVIGLWSFDDGDGLADGSGHGHALTLNGAQIVADGRFGAALESFRGYPDEDTAHQATAKDSPALSPQGAFTLELWLKPKPELEGYPAAYLVDKQYVDKTDYQLVLGAPSSSGLRVVTMRLGFGDRTVLFASDSLAWPIGEWRHVAFTYDGAGGGYFYVDGSAAGGKTEPGLGAVAPGNKPLVIGDRVGSLYHGFPGYLDQVRLSNGVLEFRPAAFLAPPQRKVYVRMEPSPTLRFELVNQLRAPVEGASVWFALDQEEQPPLALPRLAPGERHAVEYNLDTSLRPDTYQLQATVEIPGDEPYYSTERFTLTIVPREPDHMPVVMWGAGLDEIERLADLGFTHAIGLRADYGKIWEAGEPTLARPAEAVAAELESLDRALAGGVHAVAGLSPGRWARDQEEYQRVDRNGERYASNHDVCGLFDRIKKLCYDTGASAALSYGQHPAFDSALVHTEVRGETELCFHDSDRAAFKAATGLDIPEGPKSKWGLLYPTIANFPADRVIPDDDPIYRYYQWFWKQGDGWNGLHTAVHEGLQTANRPDFWTFHDPAVRVPSIYGNGGEVDYLSQWTYSYPDPLRIGMATDELFTMAGGATRPDQQVMKMTQIIWYRSQTAPEPGEEAKAQTATSNDQDVRGPRSGTAAEGYQAQWEKEIPDARFITIAPMHLREAFWTKMARPIQGIMYHGWQSLVPVEESSGAYRYTHPDTQDELRRLVTEVLEPLGPTLKQVPDRPTDVGFVESFASQMFARRGTWGWNGGWAGDAYLILHYAQLQPKILYEETINQEGLDRFKVLVLVDCDVLPRSVVDKVNAWQAAGGIIVGDENLCPGVQPDILMPSHTRPKEAEKGKHLMLDKAAALRQELDPHYQRYAASAAPEVITRVRRYGTTDYVFAINDRREFGDYVGHHGLVMENGLPTETTLYINRPQGHIYDLQTHRQVTAGGDGHLAIDSPLGPCEGRLLMITAQPIDGVRLYLPETVVRGGQISVGVAVQSPNEQTLDAVVPVHVRIIDPNGREAEYSGYYGAVEGQKQLPLNIAPNDQPGLWRVEATELASGKTANGYFRVTAE